LLQFCEDLETVVQRVQEEDWRQAVLHLHDTYVVQGAGLKGRLRADGGAVEELLRQKAGMAQSVGALQRSQRIDQERSAQTGRQQMMESTELLEELNDLRQERHSLKQEVARLKNQQPTAGGAVSGSSGYGGRARKGARGRGQAMQSASMSSLSAASFPGGPGSTMAVGGTRAGPASRHAQVQ
jgi:hypothetical protein